LVDVPDDDPDPPPPDADPREYRWRFASGLSAPGADPVTYVMNLVLSRVRCVQVRTRARVEPTTATGLGAFGAYVRDGTTPEVRRCAHTLVEKGTAARLPSLDLVDFVLAFTRDAIPYRSDLEEHGVAQRTSFPLETLDRRVGDCEDHAILAAALLHSAGFDVILVVLRLRGGPDHVGIGVPAVADLPVPAGRRVSFEGRQYWYGEATPAGTWRLGEIPREMERDLEEAIPVPVK